MRTASLTVILLGALAAARAGDEPLPPPARDEADKAAFERAQNHFQEKRFDKARDELLGLIGTGRANRWVGWARLSLAQVYERQGDEPAMLKQLEAAAREPATPTERGIMDTSDTRQEAIQRIGRYYLRKGDYQRARESFTRWEPRSWCGTCLMSMRAERERLLLVCRLHLGEQSAVARELLEAARGGREMYPESAALLFRLYHEAGQGDDLVDLLSGSEGAMRGDAVRYLLRVQQLAAKKDAAALIPLCRDSAWVSTTVEGVSTADWKCRSAADALARCLGDDVTPVLKAIKEPTGSASWLIYALGKSGTPKALEWLTDRARNDISGHEIDNITYAISLHGEAGKRVLTTLAEEMNNHVGAFAKDRLRAASPTDPFERPWPFPKRGSLPR